MAGLVPDLHVGTRGCGRRTFSGQSAPLLKRDDVDARDKPAHDGRDERGV